MKLLYLPVLIGLASALIGCSQEDELVLPAAPAAATSLDISAPSVQQIAPDGSITANVAADRPERGQDSEESAATINRSELVYQRWNDALGEFRQKNGRLPGTLKELEQSYPELANFRPPAGFKLELYAKFGSIEFAPVNAPTTGAVRL